MWPVITVLIGIAVAVGAVWGLRQWFDSRIRWQLQEARQEFQKRREWLEADFLKAARAMGVPRGLIWDNCEFHDDVAFARDRATNELRAFVAMTVAFRAVEGGQMEEVEAVGDPRAATAVFRYAKKAWHADGRAIFNLNPTQTLQHYRSTLELLE